MNQLREMIEKSDAFSIISRSWFMAADCQAGGCPALGP